ITRVRVLILVILGVFSFLSVMLWRIQVARGTEFKEDLERQSVRRVRIPGMRGRIYDRHREVLADNRPSYCIALYIEELRQPGKRSRTIDRVESVIAELSGIMEIPPEITRRHIETHYQRRLPLPLIAWRDIDEVAQAKWAEKAATMPGADQYIDAVRVYPHGEDTCHLIGYVGRAKIEKDEAEPFNYYQPEMAGIEGMEKTLDAELRGEAGGRLMRIDVKGFRRDDKTLDTLMREPRMGGDVQLTLDLRAQKTVREALGDEHGAGVVMDPRNGHILALVSTPGFDANTVRSNYSLYSLDEENKPLFNRAVSGQYAPGSIFKPLVAIAAIENNHVQPGMLYDCFGNFTMGGITWRCAHRAQHGRIGFRQALTVSCNVFFYKLGNKIGYQPIYHQAWAAGLGQKTGIEVFNEKPGLLPDDAWSREKRGHGWRKGDTINFSIGHGALSVTPLQMAVLASTLAQRGRMYKPQIVLGRRASGEEDFVREEPVLLKDMSWSTRTLDIVLGGMKDVVMTTRGTGHRAFVPGLVIGAKTGTAEYGPRDSRKYWGWMIAFAPYENPRYAIALVVEDAISGGVSAGPKVSMILKELLIGAEEEESRG
ncbi:MAG: penicillin-binding protein 2, partial [Verrucomicrobiota bacterium]